MPETANTIRVAPAPGLVVLDPQTRQPLPPEGAEVPATAYWLRRLNDGDVLLVVVEPASKATSVALKGAAT